MLHSQAPEPDLNISPEYFNEDLVRNLPAAIYTCDLSGRINFFNDAVAELWGRRPEIGKDYWCGAQKIYYPDGTPMELENCPMARTVKEGSAPACEEIIIERPDGVRINVLPHPKPIVDREGRIVGAMNMLVDISGRKMIEDALEVSEKKYQDLSLHLEDKIIKRTAKLIRSEERYHKMIDEVQDYAIILLDKDGFILNWNKGAQHIKGYSEKEIKGKNFRLFYPEKDRLEKLPERLIDEASVNGRAMHEGWRIRKDGTKFWGSIVITALHDEKRNIIGFSKVTRDLTEKKLANDRLEAYAKDIEKQNKQLEGFAFIASHDLQEPLRKIRIFCDMVKKHKDDKEELDKYLEKINSSASRMSDLIKDVLSYSLVSQTEELFEDTDLNRVLQNIRTDFDLMFSEKNVTLIYPSMPVIKGIAVQLHQLFANLISNAVKFTEKDPVIEITVKKISGAELEKNAEPAGERDYWIFTLSDNGIGIDPEYNEQIFQLFKRLNNSAKGTGIGLSLCKKIVENHHGRISVASEVGKGTAFTIILPARPE